MPLQSKDYLGSAFGGLGSDVQSAPAYGSLGSTLLRYLLSNKGSPSTESTDYIGNTGNISGILPGAPSPTGIGSLIDIGGLGSGLAGALGSPGGYAGLQAGGGLPSGLSLSGLLGSMVGPAIGSIASGQPSSGLVTGPAGYLGGYLGNQLGQGLTGLLGLESAPARGAGLTGLFSQGLQSLGLSPATSNTIGQLGTTLGSVLAGHQFGPLGALGLGALNTGINAIQGKNVSQNLASMLMMGLPQLTSGIPVVGNVIAQTLQNPLAAIINAIAQQLGLASSGVDSAFGGLGGGLGFGGGISYGGPGMAGYGLDVGGYGFGSTDAAAGWGEAGGFGVDASGGDVGGGFDSGGWGGGMDS